MHVNNKPGYKRSDWYYNAARIEYRRDNVFSQTDNEKHERRRKQMAPGVSLLLPHVLPHQPPARMGPTDHSPSTRAVKTPTSRAPSTSACTTSSA